MSTATNSGTCGTSAVLTPRERLLVGAIAERVVESLRTDDNGSRSLRLVDAHAVAQALGVDPKTVYRHADKLGAIRVGRRLRFDLDQALRNWSSEESDRCPSEKSQPSDKSATKPPSGTYHEAANASHCQLLPVGRRTEARKA
jgi:hypothetical protein